MRANDSSGNFAQLDLWLERMLAAAPSARAGILADCQDPALRRELEALLALDPAVGPLDRTPLNLAAQALGRDAQRDSRQGAMFGAYRLRHLIGEGGMATVWLASRDDGTLTRDVAVKCLKIGLATPELHARFLREQQILARLTHPNIARLYDAGISADGVPYIVMEYVDGEPITRYCDRLQLPLGARLGLLRQVLGAVAFAHQNLIVHRDLKPANILIGNDGTPTLLDFGIAKLLDVDGDDGATRTQTRALTPGYAAPEQFSGDAITTATDVYALGVIAFELLTGCRPQHSGLSGSDASSSREAPLASTRVSQWRSEKVNKDTMPHPADVAAQVRGSSGASNLARTLRGDLDTLVATALQADPARRYVGATALDEDVGRYLQRRPLRAQPDRWAYRVGKFARRNWLALGAVAAIILALGAGAGIAAWQAQQARRHAAHAEAVQAFLLSVFETARPGPRADSLLTTRELVERAAHQLQTQLSSEREINAPLRLALGRVYRKMGLLDQALPLLTDAVADARQQGDDGALADALEALGRVHIDALKFSVALSAFDEALALRRSMHATPTQEAATLLGLGETQSNLGALEAAIASLRNGLARLDAAVADDPALRLRLLSSLAVALRRADRPDNAIAIAEQAVADARKSFGTRTREEASALSVLGSIQRHAGRLRDAESSLRATVSIDLDVYHQPVPAHLHNLGTALHDLGDYAQAEQMLRDALAAQIAELGAEHPAVGNYQKELALALHSLGREAEAETLLRAALAHTEQGYDAQSPEVGDKKLALADVLLARAEVSPARQLYQSVIEAASMPGAGRLRLRALALAGLARDDAAVGDNGHASQLAREALAAAQPSEALEPQERIGLELDSGEMLLAAGDRDEAGAQFDNAEKLAATILSEDHPLHARALFDQARLAHASADSAKARAFIERSLPVLQRHLPAKHPLLVSALALRDSLAR